MAEDYFSQKTLQSDTTVGRRSRPISEGIAQDSLLGPNFWWMLIDGLLRMALPEGITLVGFVDDAVAIIVAPDLNTAQLKTEIMMRKFARWMGGAWTALAKTKIVILSVRRIETIVLIPIGNQVIESKLSAVYLG